MAVAYSLYEKLRIGSGKFRSESVKHVASSKVAGVCCSTQGPEARLFANILRQHGNLSEIRSRLRSRKPRV